MFGINFRVLLESLSGFLIFTQLTAHSSQLFSELSLITYQTPHFEYLMSKKQTL